MELTLNPKDLAAAYQKRSDRHGVDQSIPTSAVTFEKLCKDAQAAVVAVGKGTFRTWDGSNYNAVYPPKTA